MSASASAAPGSTGSRRAAAQSLGKSLTFLAAPDVDLFSSHASIVEPIAEVRRGGGRALSERWNGLHFPATRRVAMTLQENQVPSRELALRHERCRWALAGV